MTGINRRDKIHENIDGCKMVAEEEFGANKGEVVAPAPGALWVAPDPEDVVDVGDATSTER